MTDKTARDIAAALHHAAAGLHAIAASLDRLGNSDTVNSKDALVEGLGQSIKEGLESISSTLEDCLSDDQN